MPDANRDVVTELEGIVRSRLISTMSDLSGEFAAMSTVNLLGRWFNWQARQVPVRPRVVHESKELMASQEARDHATELAQIRSEISVGADLMPRLSKDAAIAYNPGSQRGPKKKEPYLDRLMSEWGIHHLHLVPAPGRSGLLLFVVFRPDDAYLLQLLPHGSWAKESLIEIILQNWPDAELTMGQLKGVTGLAQTISEEDRLKLRKAGVSTLMEVNGGVHVVGIMSTAGMSVFSTMKGDQIMRGLHGWRQKLAEDPMALDELARSNGHSLIGEGVWEPYLVDGDFGFEERAAALRVPVGHL
jgi:hypothetical protein